MDVIVAWVLAGLVVCAIAIVLAFEDDE